MLSSQPQQLTLVFDAGASSKATLEKLEADTDHSVTAVRPCSQQGLLAEAADRLEDVTLSTGAVVRAWRTQRVIAGRPRDAVVVFSPQLYEGQVRGLHQHLARCGEQLNLNSEIKPLIDLLVTTFKERFWCRLGSSFERRLQLRRSWNLPVQDAVQQGNSRLQPAPTFRQVDHEPAAGPPKDRPTG